MRPKLQLVKPSRQTSPPAREVREIRFRYPADEEAWEVSCDDCDEEGQPTPALRTASRRAS